VDGKEKIIFSEFDSKTPSLFVFGDKIYELSVVGKRDIDRVLKDEYLRQALDYRERLQREWDQYSHQLCEEYQRKERRLQLERERMVNLSSLHFTMRFRIRTAREGEAIDYILPFHYAPEFLNRRKIIFPPMEEFTRDIYIAFRYVFVDDSSERKLYGVTLLDREGRIFPHYHGGSFESCLGRDFHFDPNISLTDLPQLRDRIEDLYRNINTADLVNGYPLDLPEIGSIKTETKNYSETIWRTE